MRQRALAFMLAMLVAVTGTACAGTDKTQEEEKTAEADTEEVPEESEEKNEVVIGVCTPKQPTDTWSGDVGNLKAGLEEEGWTVKVKEARDGAEQAAQIQELADQEGSALILAPVEPEAVSEALADYEEKEIPVISYSRLVPNTDAVNYYVGFDSEAAGQETGKYIESAKDLENAKDAGKIYTIEFLLGDSEDLDTQFFYEGLMEVLKPYFEEGVLQSKSGRTEFMDLCLNSYQAQDSKAKTSEILSQFYGEKALDIVCVETDQMVDGVEEALVESSYALHSSEHPWPVLTGQDASESAIRRVLSGQQGITVSREYELLDESCVDILKDKLSGEKVKVNTSRKYDNGSRIVPAQLSDVQLIDLDNYKILMDMGIYTEEELEGMKTVEK